MTEQPLHPVLPADARNWAMGAHLSALAAALVALAFIGPLVVWLLKKDEHPYVAEHAREALNFQLSALLYGTVGGLIAFVLAFVTFGLGLILIVPLAVAAGIAWLVLTVIAAVKASNGEPYRYPVTIRFVT